MALVLVAETAVSISRWRRKPGDAILSRGQWSRRVARPADRRLQRWVDAGGVHRARHHVSRLIAIFSWAGRSHRADVGAVGDEPYLIGLARKAGYLRDGAGAGLIPLARQFNLVDRDGSLGHQHIPFLHNGAVHLSPGLPPPDRCRSAFPEIGEPVQRALQDEDRGMLVEHLGAFGAADIQADQLALDGRGREPLIP